MKKRFLSLLLAAAMLLGLTAGMRPAVLAEEAPELIAYPAVGGNVYFDAQTQTVVKADPAITALELPAEIGGTAVKKIGSGLFYYSTTLRSVRLPAGLELIDERAFSECTALEEAVIGGVTAVGECAFLGCTKLKTLTLGGVETIGYSAFGACRALETLVLPSGLKRLELEAFRDCTALTAVELPAELEVLGDAAFSGCTALQTVVLPDGLRVLDGYAFSGCTALQAVVLPDGLEVLGDDAFLNCAALTALPTLPEGLTTVGENVFRGTAAWKDAANWTDGLLYADGWLLESRDSARTTLSLAPGTRGIAAGALREHVALAAVELPEGLERIGAEAFSGDCELKKLVFPTTLTAIGRRAFVNCTVLAAACFLGDAPELGQYAFYRDGYNSIGQKEFFPLENLTLYHLTNRAGWVTITEYVVAVWNGFDVPVGSVVYTVDGGKLHFDMETGTICGAEGALTHLEVPEKINGASVRRIDPGVFADQTALTTVELPDSVSVIGDGAFCGCTALRTIRLPKRMQALGASALEGCTALQSIILPEGLERLEARTFFGCKALNLVTFSEGLTAIGMECFKQCGLLTRLVFPESLREIYLYAFESCRSLETVSLPAGLESIGESAFCDCTSLKTITIPAAVTSMYLAFERCTALKEAYFLGDAPYQGETAFVGCDVTIFFPADAAGWTTPEWHGIPAYPFPHVHSFVSQVIAPTCTEPGYILQRCSCGESRKTDFTDPLGHAYQDGICTRCGVRDPNVQPPPPPVRFKDVPSDAWYRDAVAYAVTHGLMNGVGGGRFAPEENMSRAMLVTVLWRSAGQPAAEENVFSDVPDGAWYTEAVAWAAARGVVQGVGEGKFDPDGAITREQTAVILFRYAAQRGGDTTARAKLSAFADADKVSAYAAEALRWAVGAKLISGSKENGKRYLLPQAPATRAQLAALLMRFLGTAE